MVPQGEHSNMDHGTQIMDVSKNSGFSPQIIHSSRVFHDFHHPFWGVYTSIFWKDPYKKIQQMAAFLAWGLTTSQKKTSGPPFEEGEAVFGNESRESRLCWMKSQNSRDFLFQKEGSKTIATGFLARLVEQRFVGTFFVSSRKNLGLDKGWSKWKEQYCCCFF